MALVNCLATFGGYMCESIKYSLCVSLGDDTCDREPQFQVQHRNECFWNSFHVCGTNCCFYKRTKRFYDEDKRKQGDRERKIEETTHIEFSIYKFLSFHFDPQLLFHDELIISC